VAQIYWLRTHEPKVIELAEGPAARAQAAQLGARPVGLPTPTGRADRSAAPRS
jgi:hypothetical protein